MPIKIVFLPNIPGSTMQDKKNYCISNLDWVRKILMNEPRGYDNSYGIIITSPTRKDADFGALYIDPTGWHDMCGHASMGFSSIVVRLGLVSIVEPITNVVLDTPAGLVNVKVHIESGEVRHVSLVNVASFVLDTKKVEVDGYGEVRVYISFGGDFYGIINLEELGLKWNKNTLPELISIARQVWNEIDDNSIAHPIVKGVKGIYGIRFVEKVSDNPYRAYGILIFGSKDKPLIDRSPSGTGTSAHLAYLHYIGELRVGEKGDFTSAINTVFEGKILSEATVGPYKAIVPQITSKDKGGYITGYSTWVVENDDPIGLGFQL